jgi:hypothetical protein
MTAPSDRLMTATKARPAETEGEVLGWLDHGQQQTTNLWHRQREEVLCRSPFSV